jgi:hypothetical protein
MDKNLFTNKVIYSLKIAIRRSFLSLRTFGYKEFEEGFADALKEALTKVGVSSPVEMLPSRTPDAAQTVVHNTAQSLPLLQQLRQPMLIRMGSQICRRYRLMPISLF